MNPTSILTANPNFTEFAQKELHQAQPDSRILEALSPGVMAVHSEGGFFSLAEPWRKQPPIFVRHICPVHEVIPLAGTAKDITTLQRAVKREFLDLLEPDLPFSVQTRIFSGAPYKPFDINSTLSNTIEQITQAPLNVRQPAQILSVVVGETAAYLGISLASHNISNWAGGVHRFARLKGQISRAEFKLLEALAVFDIQLSPGGVALDLGAAPGGWTKVLRQRDQYVTAVDPADLHPSLSRDTRVRHKRKTAEAYLAEGPDRFDLIVNDMRQDARDSARLMAAYSRCLYKGGMGVMTFKLPESGRSQVLDHAFNILRETYQIGGARQLFHNRSEITVYLRQLKPA
jgi:23S rRNA (cytidine2498-2'-O)-methyltransferase